MDEDLVSAAADELYATDPAAFVARRTELSAAAKGTGDAAASRAITRLHRPTRSAWIVNHAVRDDPELLDPLRTVGTALREAHRTFDGARLRDLTVERRTAVEVATAKAVALLGEPVSETVRGEVAATFEAALADVAAAEQVSAGRLARPLSFSGFGEGMPTLSAVPDTPVRRLPPRASSEAADSDADAERQAQSRRREMAEAEFVAADDQVSETKAVAAEANDRIATLEAALVEARTAATEANRAVRAAESRRTVAARRLQRLDRS